MIGEMAIQRAVNEWLKPDKGRKILTLQAADSRYDTKDLWTTRTCCGLRKPWASARLLIMLANDHE